MYCIVFKNGVTTCFVFSSTFSVQIESGEVLAADIAELVNDFNPTTDDSSSADTMIEKRAQNLAQSVNILDSLVDLQTAQLNGDTHNDTVERQDAVTRFNAVNI